MAIPLSRRMDFSEIPQIDAGGLMSGNPDPALIDKLRMACEEVGFFYVRNHGIPEHLITDMRAASSAFFAEPMSKKMQVPLNARMRGYLPLDYTSYEDEPDEAKSHQEGFWMAHDQPESDRYFLEGPNIWPEDHPDLRRTMEAYMAAADRLSDALRRGFSQAAGFGQHGLDPYFTRPQTRLKINHYPPQDAPETVKHIGVVPHSDSDAFTILWQDEGDGLEIENKSGTWVGAPSIPGTFVINIGNIMQTWTGGQFSSTPHRVINRGGRDRYSIPVFVYPDHDAPIGPLDGDARAEAGTQNCGSYLHASWKRTFPIAGIA